MKQPFAPSPMELTALDWTIVLISLAACFVPAIFFARRAGSNITEFFTSGRSAPWWLIGVSMVATTFSTDTPNLVTSLVRERGVSYNWVWWAFLLTGMMTVFFYARLWRRSAVLTDLEFYELRYSGKPAGLVRGFRAIYLGLIFNCVIIASVNLAAAKIANVILGWPMGQTLLICGIINVLFAATSGLWGVMAIDLIQFAVAMGGAITVAWFALKQPEVGGLSGLLEQIDPKTLSLLPDFGDWGLTLTVLIIPLTVQWWSVWYPGAEPGGGSYVAQRMLAARSEKDSMAATFFFNVAHYALRPWPWILVALCSLLVYPTLDHIQQAFPHVDPRLIHHDMAYPAMFRFLPAGILGLLVASMLAAYISTITTQLNWGSSYLVHDFYQRFINAGASEKHYVMVSRLATAGLMIIAGAFTFVLESARHTFELLLSIGAGTGLIYLLRWYWWRVNAWSEIAAMAGSFVMAFSFFFARRAGLDIEGHMALLGTVAVTTALWVAVSFLTPPTNRNVLLSFYRLVRPAGPGWTEIRAESGVNAPPDRLPQALLGWMLGCLLVYAALFGTGSLLYGKLPQATLWLVIFAGSAWGLTRILRQIWSERPDEGPNPSVAISSSRNSS